MKNLVNLIALVMLVSVNILTPFSYAQENPELEMEANTLESNETGNGIQTDNILDDSNQNTNIGLDGDEKIGSNIEEQKGTLDENNGEGKIDISGVQPKKLGIKGNLGGINLMSINQEDPVQIVRDGEIVSTYTGLSQAINEAESGDVINLMEDISVTEASVIAGKSLTINGNNYIMTRDADITTLTVNEDSSLKLIDVTITDNAVNFAPNRYDSLIRLHTHYIYFCTGGVIETRNESGEVISSVCDTTNVDTPKTNPQIYSVGDIYGDNLTISNSLNSKGSAAIIVEKGGIEMINSNFIHNGASGTSNAGRGGAIRVGPNTATNIVDESPITKILFSGCLFESNYGRAYGGALAIHYAPEVVTIDNCIFSGNTAYLNGGAIHIPNIWDKPTGYLPAISTGSTFPVGTLYVNNSEFYNNWCGNDGAAIENDDMHLQINSSNFEHNYGTWPEYQSVGVISCQAGGTITPEKGGRGLIRREYHINKSTFKDTNTVVLGDHQWFGSYFVDNCLFENQESIILMWTLAGEIKNSVIKNSNPFGNCGMSGGSIRDIDIADNSNGTYNNKIVPNFGESTFRLENNTYSNDCKTNEYFPVRSINQATGTHSITIENDDVKIFVHRSYYDSANIQGTDEIYYGATIDDGKFAYIKKNKFYNFDEFNNELEKLSYGNSGYQLESGKTMLFYLDSGYTELWSGSISTTTNLYGKETDVYNITYEGMEGVNFEGITHTYKFNNLNHTQYLTELTPYILNTPSKKGYKFEGWYLDSEYTIPVTSIETGSTGDITLYAKWERVGYSGGGDGGGSRGGSSKDDILNDGEKSTEQSTGNQEDPSISSQNDDDVSSGANVENSENTTQKDSSTVSENDGKIYSPEFQQAYEFAKKNGITTKSTIKEAKMDGKLTRIEMAKMLSYYAINVMGKTPDTTKNVKFRDVTKKMDERYDNGVILAYQLGIMGQNMPRNRFRPNDEVSRAEFVTALSRMLYQTSDGEYEKTAKYYIPHMSKLYNEGIVNDVNPGMKERRGYVMIMLMRAVK